MSGIAISAGATHRDKDGNLISRHVFTEPPTPPTCVKPSCLWRYFSQFLTYSVIILYHSRRMTYAEANRRKTILERYRTGEPSPKTLWQAIHANIKLACPICRKYNVDPFLFKKED